MEYDLTLNISRITFHASRFTHHASRITFHVSRFTLLIVLLGCVIGCSGKDEPLRQSEALIQSGMHPEAINLLEKIIAVDDRNPKARFLLGQAYEGLGSYDQAIHHYKTAINLYAAHPEDKATVRFALAKVYLKQGIRDSGYHELRAIVRSTSDNAVLQQVAGLITDAYQVEQLTSGKDDNYSPRFSADGSRIAFASYRLDNGELFIMDINGRVRQRVTYTTDFDEGESAFLHDPHYLIYSREPQTSRQVKILLQSSGSSPIYAGFYTTHIHSKVTQEVMPVGFGVRSLGISPDRQHVAYESVRDGTLELYILDLRGVDLGAIDPQTIPSQQITHNEVDDGSPVFFPDGQRIAFVSPRAADPQNEQSERHQIYSINIDGSDEKHLNPNPHDCYSPVISSDGKTIAFVSMRDGDIEIYLMDADGSNERRLTNGIGASMQPAFSPDGRLLAFVSDRSDTFQIYLMHLDRPLTKRDLLLHLE
ncbi:hypothetical protein C6502_00530 [Candidatus Poribacteria bacterium]|nr:MAG: hypothetical protein C6502_00530 [Candidatus Poribacteria bacterium]